MIFTCCKHVGRYTIQARRVHEAAGNGGLSFNCCTSVTLLLPSGLFRDTPAKAPGQLGGLRDTPRASPGPSAARRELTRSFRATFPGRGSVPEAPGGNFHLGVSSRAAKKARRRLGGSKKQPSGGKMVLRGYSFEVSSGGVLRNPSSASHTAQRRGGS